MIHSTRTTKVLFFVYLWRIFTKVFVVVVQVVGLLFNTYFVCYQYSIKSSSVVQGAYLLLTKLQKNIKWKQKTTNSSNNRNRFSFEDDVSWRSKCQIAALGYSGNYNLYKLNFKSYKKNFTSYNTYKLKQLNTNKIQICTKNKITKQNINLHRGKSGFEVWYQVTYGIAVLPWLCMMLPIVHRS